MNIPILTKLSEARIDSEGCMVEGIILAAGLSENGTFYPANVVESSAGIFRGVQCYTDHPRDGEAERSVRDVVGVIEDTWAESGCLHATIRLSRAHDWLLTMISEGLIGDLSINALGKTRVGRQDDRVVREVMEITKAHSVDFVARAAAGGRVERIVRESAGYGESLRLLERISLPEFIEARPDLAESIRNEARRELLKERQSGEGELAKLEEEVARRKARLECEAIAMGLIDNCGLPVTVRRHLLDEALAIQADDEQEYSDAVARMIEEHRGYLSELAGEGLIRGMGSSRDDVTMDGSRLRSTLRLMGVA